MIRKSLSFRISLAGVLFALLLLASPHKASAQPSGPSNEANIFGLVGGMAITSNPAALQKYTNRANYYDGNGGMFYLYHNQVNNWYAFEWQLSTLFSSVNTMDVASDQTKCKFIVPLDFRWFLGNPVIQAYAGIGLQYNTVWIFTEGTSHTHNYYDPWYGWWSEDVSDGNDDWDWTINQLSTNLAFGLKLGFGNMDDTDFKRHALVLGTKFHFPLINASEKYGSGEKTVDLQRDRTNVSLTAALSIMCSQSFTFKLDYELPCGGNNTYEINDGGHATFLNSRSQSLSLSLLFSL